MKRVWIVSLCALTLISFAPILGLLLSMAVANAIGCPLDEGSAHCCMVAGMDLGDALNSAFVLG